MLESCLFINEGNGTFTKNKLEARAQLTPIYASLADDFDGDGHLDLLLGGNHSRVKPQLGGNSSNYGSMLKGDGTGNFTFLPAIASGFTVRGEIRDIKTIQIRENKHIFVAKNNDKLDVFRTK